MVTLCMSWYPSVASAEVRRSFTESGSMKRSSCHIAAKASPGQGEAFRSVFDNEGGAGIFVEI